MSRLVGLLSVKFTELMIGILQMEYKGEIWRGGGRGEKLCYASRSGSRTIVFRCVVSLVYDGYCEYTSDRRN